MHGLATATSNNWPALHAQRHQMPANGGRPGQRVDKWQEGVEKEMGDCRQNGVVRMQREGWLRFRKLQNWWCCTSYAFLGYDLSSYINLDMRQWLNWYRLRLALWHLEARILPVAEILL